MYREMETFVSRFPTMSTEFTVSEEMKNRKNRWSNAMPRLQSLMRA